MKTNVMFFAVLIFSGFGTFAYAHPDPVGVIVQNQNNDILYTNELGAVPNDKSSLELLSAEWFYHNFTLILASIIIAIMIPVGTMTYKEDIKSLISN